MSSWTADAFTRRQGLLILNRCARNDERALKEAQVHDWWAAAMPLAVGFALSRTDGDVLCPFGIEAPLGIVGAAPTLEDGASLGPDGPNPFSTIPAGRAFVGRSRAPKTSLPPA
jgi:hypothetical protein